MESLTSAISAMLREPVVVVILALVLAWLLLRFSFRLACALVRPAIAVLLILVAIAVLLAVLRLMVPPRLNTEALGQMQRPAYPRILGDTHMP